MNVWGFRWTFFFAFMAYHFLSLNLFDFLLYVLIIQTWAISLEIGLSYIFFQFSARSFHSHSISFVNLKPVLNWIGRMAKCAHFFFPHCTPFTSSVSIENARYATNANHLENYIRFARLPVLVSSLNVPVLALIYSRIGHLNRLHIKLMTKKCYLSWHLHCLDFCIVLDLNGDELHRI